MSQWGEQPQPPQQPQGYYQQPPQSSRGRTGLIIAAVIAALALIGLIGFILLNQNNQSNESNQSKETSAPSTTQTQAAAPSTQTAPETVTVTQEAQPPVTVTDRTTVREVPQQSLGGWHALMNRYTVCTSPEYAGTNGTDYISVCPGANGRVYHAWVNGKELTLEGRTTRIDWGRYKVNANPNAIEISGPDVRVYDASGSLAYELYLDEWSAH